MPGVPVVLTGADLPGVRFGRYLRDRPVLAVDRVGFIGERVAAVAAETREAAEEAVHLIEVDDEDLPAAYDPREALTAEAPVLHPDPVTYQVQRGDRTLPEHLDLQGDLTQGSSLDEMGEAFARAAHVFAHTSCTPTSTAPEGRGRTAPRRWGSSAT